MSDTPESDAARIIERHGGTLATFQATQIVPVTVARRLERERNEAESRRKEIYMQLHRVCLEAFNMDDTIGLESFDDYLLRKISGLEAINAELSAWINESAPVMSAAFCIVIEEKISRLDEIAGCRAILESCPIEWAEKEKEAK